MCTNEFCVIYQFVLGARNYMGVCTVLNVLPGLVSTEEPSGTVFTGLSGPGVLLRPCRSEPV